MRPALAIVLALAAAACAGGQPVPPAKGPVPPDPLPRYGVNSRAKVYPQDTPKAALKSAVAAVEKGDYAYLVAQLLDPTFVDEAVADRAKGVEAAVETELAQVRDAQRAYADRIAPEDRVPFDPRAFRAAVARRARDRGFKQLVADVEQKLADDPQAVKDFRRVLRDGTFSDADPTATATHPDLKGRSLYFKKIDGRWVLENRQAEEPKKEP